ncbi:MAG TPA: hypothetical protein VG604_04335 [Candidatus Saccharimonadales bacterium]|nr:hypothetical protein [Candidatus Saccharimonadales bacterium]
MHKIATRVFVCASVAFGVLGIYMVLSNTDPGDKSHGFSLVVSKLFVCSIFVILSSFALSVAGKYLSDK